MSLIVTQTYSAIAAGLTASFLATGGTEPYIWSVLPGGAGGTIDPDTGVYTAPAVVNTDLAKAFDTIQAEDSDLILPLTGTAQILVGSPLQLFCDIIQQGMGLSNGRVYLWDQKIMQPTDSGLYVAVSLLRQKTFFNGGEFDGSGNYLQWTNQMATLGLDIISRGLEAREQKEFVLMTLASIYAEQQMNKNSFFIGKLPPGSQFVNLSNPDGAAIPYRFHIDVNMQYMVRKTTAIEYFDAFEEPTVATNP